MTNTCSQTRPQTDSQVATSTQAHKARQITQSFSPRAHLNGAFHGHDGCQLSSRQGMLAMVARAQHGFGWLFTLNVLRRHLYKQGASAVGKHRMTTRQTSSKDEPKTANGRAILQNIRKDTRMPCQPDVRRGNTGVCKTIGKTTQRKDIRSDRTHITGGMPIHKTGDTPEADSVQSQVCRGDCRRTLDPWEMGQPGTTPHSSRQALRPK